MLVFTCPFTGCHKSEGRNLIYTEYSHPYFFLWLSVFNFKYNLPRSRNEHLSESLDTFCTFYESLYSLERFERVGITYIVESKSFRPDKLFKVTEIKQISYFST
jgi:hypothetical protein